MQNIDELGHSIYYVCIVDGLDPIRFEISLECFFLPGQLAAIYIYYVFFDGEGPFLEPWCCTSLLLPGLLLAGGTISESNRSVMIFIFDKNIWYYINVNYLF